MNRFIKSFVTNQSGATAIEYGLIAALIAVAAIGAMSSLGNGLKSTFGKTANELNNAVATSGTP